MGSSCQQSNQDIPTALTSYNELLALSDYVSRTRGQYHSVAYAIAETLGKLYPGTGFGHQMFEYVAELHWRSERRLHEELSKERVNMAYHQAPVAWVSNIGTPNATDNSALKNVNQAGSDRVQGEAEPSSLSLPMQSFNDS